jgi:gamma-glutamylcyclotransferase (GGCT)/AIG2-like uncharacterized protein YtfP
MAEQFPRFDTSFLFVYGALRRGFPLHHHLRRLGAIFVGVGKVRAEILKLGKFPGARRSDTAAKTVAGEVYRLGNAAKALKVLDQVEGFSPQSPQRAMFQRAMTEVTAPNGERRLASIYWLHDRRVGKTR